MTTWTLLLMLFVAAIARAQSCSPSLSDGSFVESCTVPFATDGGKSISVSISGGDTPIAVVHAFTWQTVSVSDPVNGAWLPLSSVLYNSNEQLAGFYCPNCQATASVNSSISGSAVSNDFEVSDYRGLSALEQQSATTGNNTNPISPSLSTTGIDRLVVGYTACQANYSVHLVREEVRANDAGKTVLQEIPAFLPKSYSTNGTCGSGAWAAGIAIFSKLPVVNSSPVWVKNGSLSLPSGSGNQFSGVYEATVLYESNPLIISCATSLFKMWYNSADGVRYAESLDGINWLGYGKNPIISNKYKSRVFHAGSTYYLPVVDKNSPNSIDIWTSTDGVSFSLAKSAALTTVSGTWEDGNLYHLNIVGIVSGTWYALYDANNLTGLATSTDGLNWTKYSGNPVLNMHAANAFSVGGSYYVWASLVDSGGATAYAPIDIFRAHSSNLINWSTPIPALWRNKVLDGFSNADNLNENSDPSLVEANGSTYLYYSFASVSSGYKQGVAIASMPMSSLVLTLEAPQNSFPFGMGTVAKLTDTAVANTAAASSISSSAFNATSGALTIVAVQHGTTFADDVSLQSGSCPGGYTKAIVDTTASANIGNMSLFYCVNSQTVTGDVIKASFSSNVGYRAIYVKQYSGLGNSPFDVAVKGVGNGTSIASANFTPAHAAELVVTFGAFATTSGTVYPASDDLTLDQTTIQLPAAGVMTNFTSSKTATSEAIGIAQGTAGALLVATFGVN